MAKFCRQCGSPLDEAVKFCPNCGTPVAVEAQRSIQQPEVVQQPQIISQPRDLHISVETHKRKEPSNMGVVKMVLGIICIALSIMGMFQSCAVGVAGTIAKRANGDGIVGILVSIILLTVGTVSIATRKHKNGNIAVIVLSVIGALFGFGLKGSFSDLGFYSFWFIVMGGISILSLVLWREANE